MAGCYGTDTSFGQDQLTSTPDGDLGASVLAGGAFGELVSCAACNFLV